VEVPLSMEGMAWEGSVIMLYGWKGKILRVDLAQKKVVKEELPEEWLRKYMGCRGINTIILYNEVGPDVAPFSPENKLIFGTGPLEGTPLGMGRVSIQTKHCNKFIGEGGAGGDWAPELKYAGYDFIVIEKKSDEPVYVYINDDEVEIRDAKDLWGKDTRQTNKILREITGVADLQVASIGQAGENLVANSKIIFTLNHAGCRGCGTIMGDKKLKAIAVHGTGGVKVRDPAEFLRTYREIRRRLDLKETGDALTPAFAFMSANFFLRVWNETRFLHAYNAQRGSIEGFLAPEEYLEKYVTKPKAGFCCPFPAGGRRYEVHEGKYATICGDEREGGFSLGAAIVGMTSWPAALKIRNLCSRYGLDEFHVLYTIGWAMECYEKGIITKKDTGIDLRFGNEDAVVEMTEKIAFREGFGDVLADGCQEAAKMIGKGSEKYLLTIKGRELEVMPQRPVYSIALCLAVCEGGPDHTRWYPPYAPNPKNIPKDLAVSFDAVNAFIPRSVKGKASWVKFLYDASAVFESMPTCLFVLRNNLGLDMRPWLSAFNACTGADYTMDEFVKAGERIVNLERAYIVREGFRRVDDTLPRRMLEEPIVDGHIPPIGKDLDLMLDEYYALRGWDIKSAIPKEEKLRELDLGFVIDDLRNLR
jgi:aldehyde:ferredoxin oxidoreductase